MTRLLQVTLCLSFRPPPAEVQLPDPACEISSHQPSRSGLRIRPISTQNDTDSFCLPEGPHPLSRAHSMEELFSSASTSLSQPTLHIFHKRCRTLLLATVRATSGSPRDDSCSTSPVSCMPQATRHSGCSKWQASDETSGPKLAQTLLQFGHLPSSEQSAKSLKQDPEAPGATRGQPTSCKMILKLELFTLLALNFLRWHRRRYRR